MAHNQQVPRIYTVRTRETQSSVRGEQSWWVCTIHAQTPPPHVFEKIVGYEHRGQKKKKEYKVRGFLVAL